MNPWEEPIEKEAGKLIARFENYARQLADEWKRRQRRSTAIVEQLTPRRPAYWGLAHGFDPYLVRARSERIAHALRAKIRSRTYVPRNPIVYTVPKPGGGTRDVSVFQVADNAASRKIFDSLMRKNRALFSSRSYAYRADISAHDAIQYVTTELRGAPRVFVAEYDFSKYFDNIRHDYIFQTLRDRGFLLTPAEDAAIRGFLAVPARDIGSYAEAGGEPRVKGVPQGTSVSLFLANIAAWDLDRALERLGVSFVRYADDTLIWSTDYAQICRAAETLHRMSDEIGAPINLEKSGGIRLLTKAGAASEMPSTDSVNYLGHRISLSALAIKQSLIDKIKKRVNALIYYNLIREARLGKQNTGRLGLVDRDYVALIWQLRRYLYGDIAERELRRIEANGTPPRRFRGVMAFFPFVDDDEQLRALDNWMTCQICMALKKRGRLLLASGVPALPAPHGLPCSELALFTGKSQSTGEDIDLRLPSPWRMSRVIRKAARAYGANVVARGIGYEYE